MFFNTNNMQLKKFTSQPIGIGTGGGSPVPADALQFWAFDNSVTDRAIRERVLGQSLLISSRASNANIIQSRDNSIITYTENEPAFNKGVGLRDEGEATNELVNNVWEGTSGTFGSPDLWLGFNLGGTRVQQPSTLLSAATAIKFTGLNGRPMIASPSLTLPVGTSTISCFVEETDGVLQAREIMSAAGAATFTFVYPVCEANPSGGALGVITTGRLIAQLVCTVSGTVNCRYGIGTSGNKEGECVLSMPQRELGETVSSVSLTYTMPATRAASNNQIPCLVENGVWSVGGVSLGNRTGAWGTNGVKADGSEMSFGSVSGVGGTFEGLAASAMSGARLILGGSIIEITGAPDTNNVTVATISGDPQDFQYPAEFEIQFITSDYFTGVDFAADTAVLDTLLDNAGYDVPSLGVAEQWPLNDFVLTFDLGYLGEDGSFPRVCETSLDASNGYFIRKDATSAKRISFVNKVAGVNIAATVNMPSDIVAGDNIICELTKSSANGTNLNIINVTKGESQDDDQPAQTENVNYGATMQICNATSTLTSPINADTATITLRPL